MQKNGSKFTIRHICQLAVLIAITVVVSRFGSISTPITRIGFTFVPIVLCAILYGPVSALVVYAVADILGAFIFYGYALPGITISCAIRGFMFGVFLYGLSKKGAFADADRLIEWIEWDNISILKLPKKFWLTFVSTIVLCVSAVFSWAQIPLTGIFTDRVVSFNLVSLWSETKQIGDLLEFFEFKSSEFTVVKTLIALALCLLLMSFILLVISLIRYKASYRSKLAYLGFGLNALVSAVFIIAVWIFSSKISEASDGLFTSLIKLTPFPLVFFTVSIISLIFVVKKPINVQIMTWVRIVAASLFDLAVVGLCINSFWLGLSSAGVSFGEATWAAYTATFVSRIPQTLVMIPVQIVLAPFIITLARRLRKANVA